MKNMIKKYHKRLLVVAGLLFSISTAYAQVADTTLRSANTTGNIIATHSIMLDTGFSAGFTGAFSATIVPSSLFNCGVLGIPSSTMNYVATYVPRIPIADASTFGSHTICEVNQTIQYLDGLGRPLQTVQVKANPKGTKDVIQPVAYDALGREPIKYLPYTTNAGTSGNYRSDALTGTSGYSNSGQYSFYNPSTPQNYSSNTSPYAVTIFEPSPLNRPLEQGAPGRVWRPSSSRTDTAGRTVVMDYGTNATSEVLLWVVNSTGATASASYAANTLYKTITKDENWTSGKIGTTEEFKNMDGHVVLKRIWQSDTSSLNTYYIYNDNNLLSYVVPPLVTATTFSESNAIFTNLIYGYHYDERDRLVQKKIPGKGWEYMVYNKIDQVVATQDANQRTNNQWIVTKYDALGRTVISGILSTTDSLTTLRTTVNSATTLWESRAPGSDYTNVAWPTAAITKLSVSYYDNYDIPNLPYDHHTENCIMTRGLTTATKINVLGTTDMLWTVNYYDDKGRVTSTYAQHYLGGTINTGNYDKIVNTYDFTNAVTASTRNHYTATAVSSPAVTIANTFVYDHVGRKRQSFENINSAASATLISQVDLNETGQAYQKHLHSTDNGSNFLQDITYSYNERGWLTNSSNSKFSLTLDYNTNISTGATPQYNGNIAQMYTTSDHTAAGSKMKYTYDALNRLTAADHSNSLLTENGISYDKMGNILGLTRSGASAAVLAYTYTGNQLTAVTNSGSAFRSYSYDGNGNATTDGTNKNISYNILNLPQTVTQSSATLATYTYEASGVKVRNTGSDGTWDYVSGIVYHNSAISFIQTEEGRAVPNGANYSYQYNLKDHLGNNRVSFDKNGVLQEDEYYAFGLRNPKYDNSNNNRYLYNGKEMQTDLANQYDYGARFYDAVIARWGHIDPKAELYFNWSPYNYALNTPINAIDPNGHLVIFINGWQAGSGVNTNYWLDSKSGKRFDWDVQWHFNDLKSRYYDGNLGGYVNTAVSLITDVNEGNLSGSNRYNAGKNQGDHDAEAIITSLSRSGGVITESLKIVSHSMGGAYAKGFVQAIVNYAVAHPELCNGLKISEFDFDPLQAAQLRAIAGVHTQQFTHNAKKHGKTHLNDLLNRIADGKQQGLDDEQGKKDGNSYTEDPSKTEHSISTFVNNIAQLEEGKYVLQNGKWVKQ
ncbi:RHS repeat-associated core domain-containing protein [Mucilaginibacter sp. HMF5004]|uniref:DUF6443 domain-containing protein n=1 Tax=Mucilaginibacter rivuli TaxID=2857527 RepID=UPI001C5F9773|nr:DUF6443 domain-containing protein [Mucilaginibacter rivuli]MBW4888469.1 RHS repeat-associated core domain-containing protein [Mucilaginibacter rivuli]